MSRMGLAGTASWCYARLSPVSSVESGYGVAVEVVLVVVCLNGVCSGVAVKVWFGNVRSVSVRLVRDW